MEPVTSKIMWITTSLVDDNPNNPRASRNEEKDAELLADISEHGITQSLFLRPVKGRYQVVAGQRRLDAARAAGIVKIPAIAREMTDEQAYEISISENITRENMNPADECIAINKLRMLGKSRDSIALIFGKTNRWVAAREKMSVMPALILDAMRSGSLEMPNAMELAKLHDDECIDALTQACAMSQKDFKAHVEGILRNLKTAPWPMWRALRHDTLGVIPPCSTCNLRSDRQTELFGESDGVARCTSDSCWKSKLEAWKQKESTDIPASSEYEPSEPQKDSEGILNESPERARILSGLRSAMDASIDLQDYTAYIAFSIQFWCFGKCKDLKPLDPSTSYRTTKKSIASWAAETMADHAPIESLREMHSLIVDKEVR